MKTYSEKLRDPRWQRKRLEVMERDGFACQNCGDNEKTLNVHHHYYEKGKSPWDYPESALATLCEDCHADIEEERLEILKLITWEVPRLNALRILRHDHFLACDYANAISNLNPEYRIKSALKVIKEMTELIEINSFPNRKRSKIEHQSKIADTMSVFDRLIESAPNDPEE